MLKFLIILLVAITPFVYLSPFQLENNSINSGGSKRSDGRNIAVSLNHFKILEILGDGGTSCVYLAKKNGGFDDGQLYALKVMNLSIMLKKVSNFGGDVLRTEREMLEAMRKTPWATGLQYAWAQGNWLFLAMDVGIGGTVASQLNGSKPDMATAKRIIAEIIVALELIHNANIIHMDLILKNIVVDSEGHLMLTDFGCSKWRTNNSSSIKDWLCVACICSELFPYPVQDDSQKSLLGMLINMTDARLPELKNHPFFDGIDWKKVADRKMEPPFQPHPIKINENFSYDLTPLLNIPIDDEFRATVGEQFHYYSFAPPEYVN